MTSLALTDRQRTELNNAILDYLTAQGDKFLQTIDYFKKEASLSGDSAELGKGILEKKWTSVIRLQKRVMELESKVEQLQQQKSVNGMKPIPEGGSSSSSAEGMTLSSDPSKLLPRPPARSCLTGHRAAVTVVISHPVYSLIASGSEDTTIRIWDAETGQYERTLKGHTGPVTNLAFDTKGLLLASCSNDMSAKIWDMNTYTCTRTLKGHDHTISAISFYSNNDQLITCSRDTTIKFWEVSTGYCIKTLIGNHSDWIKTFSISLDNNYLASSGNDQMILIWQISTGNVLQVSFLFWCCRNKLSFFSCFRRYEVMNML
jgi:platelet-activating factor acetylhydrolase IB subunit alpha